MLRSGVVKGETEEVAFAASEPLFRVAFENAPIGMVVASPDLSTVRVNHALCEMLGYSESDLLALGLWAVTHPEDIEPNLASMQRALAGEIDSYALEKRYIHRNGQVVWGRLNGSLVRDASGAPLYFVSQIEDVTERKAVHDALAASEIRFRTAFENAPIGMALIASNQRTLQVNRALCAMLGYTQAELLDLTLRDLTHPDDVAANLALVERAMAGEMESFWLEKRYIRKDGSILWAWLTASFVRDESGVPLYFISQIQDISERKVADDALAVSEERFRVAFEDAPIGVAIVRPDLAILRVNRASCEILGYPEEELLGMTFLAITHPRDREANADLIARALAGELRTYAMEKRYTRKDGRIIWAALNASLVRDDRGAPLYFISQIQDITERKAAEAEFAETQQHTRQVLERITDGFYALDRDWRFTFLNDAAEQMLDRARAELIGQNVWQAFAPAIDTPLFAAYQQAMTNGVTTSVEFFYPPLDEWFEVRVYPSADGLSVFFRDVTERRRLAQELRASEAKYRTLINQLPAVVYAVAVDQIQTPLYFSPNIEALTGYRPAELMAREKSWLEYVHPDDRERVAVEDARAIASGERLRIEYRYRRKDGSYIWILDDSGPVIGETGTVGAIQGVLLDISERVQAEEERARLAAIVEGAEDAIVSRTLAGTVTSWNRGAERLYGYRADEMIGQTFEVLLPSGDTSIELVRAAEFGIRPTHFETTRLRRDGAPVDVAIALSPIRDRDGRMIGVSSITRDITERKRVETELRAALVASQSAMRSKTLFLAMMSHELRTPLQAVVGYAEFLLSEAGGPLTPEQREDIGYIYQGAERMVALIGQLLDLSRLEAGRLELAQEPLDLRQIVEQVRQDVTPQAASKGLRLTIRLPARLPLLFGDATRVRQILLNLAGNAVKFTEQGRVAIRVGANAETVTVAVSDSGIGIAPEALPAIFEEFRQVDGSLTRRHGGAGLGLAIAKRLAEQMGGSISVESQLGVGSTFTLHLPIVSTVAERIARQPASGLRPS